MAKPPVAELEPLSPQRATLAKAITNRQQAQADHDAAETALSEAETAKWPVLAAISEAENILAQAKRMGDPDRIAVCEDELRHAQMHELPARAAVVTAKDKVAVAADHLDDVAHLVRPAVDAVIRSELSPIAATILADFQAA